MPKIDIGQPAPAFALPASNGQEIALKDYHGQVIVLYFYPKDNTPGCTKEACAFRDSYAKLKRSGAVILGVSPDSLMSHDRFIAKYELPFLLLSDEDKKVCRAYGVWVKKNLYGKEYLGVARTTFIIDKKGHIAHIFAKVKPDGHDEEVLQVVKGL